MSTKTTKTATFFKLENSMIRTHFGQEKNFAGIVQRLYTTDIDETVKILTEELDAYFIVGRGGHHVWIADKQTKDRVGIIEYVEVPVKVKKEPSIVEYWKITVISKYNRREEDIKVWGYEVKNLTEAKAYARKYGKVVRTLTIHQHD